MTDKKNGREYLSYVLEKLKERITEISLSLVEGQKEIEGMHEYYWENYTEMDQCYSLKPLFAVGSWLVYFLLSDEIRCLTGHCILSVLRQCHVQEHVLQGLYQAEHLPGRSCLSSIRIPGT